MNLPMAQSIDSLIHENWALVALAIFLGALIVRHIFMRDCVRAAKNLGKEIYKQIMRQYNAQSLFGWLLILASVVLAEAMLAFPGWLPLWTTRRDAGFMVILAFVLGVFLHVRAMYLATVSIFRERTELDRNF